MIVSNNCGELFAYTYIFKNKKKREISLSVNLCQIYVFLVTVPSLSVIGRHLSDLIASPSFIRFNNVQICYWLRSQPIEEKCEMFESHLVPLKPALNDSNMIEFWARISQDYPPYFTDHSFLLNYLQNRLLGICDSSRGYKFRISFWSDENAISNVISSILQMPPMKRCSNVEIEIYGTFGLHKQFPVEIL